MFIVEKDPNSVISEQYKKLRTNIEYSSYDNELKIIAVTSAILGEGKSTSSGNLAFSLCQNNKKVLLIDCDLRKPTIHKKFNISNECGISEMIVQKKLRDECIQKYNDNLDILTSGKIPPNPSEMIGMKKFSNIINSFRENYDYIILDTPPILIVSEASILATYADGVILVVREGTAKKQEIIKAKNLLVNMRAKIIGAVLNDCKYNKSDYNFKYYDYGHEKESNSKKDRNLEKNLNGKEKNKEVSETNKEESNVNSEGSNAKSVELNIKNY